MDLPQVLILTAIFILTVILTIIGVQIITILRDARDTLRKADHVLDNVDFLTTSLTRGSHGFAQLASSLQSGLQVVNLVTRLLGSSKKK